MQDDWIINLYLFSMATIQQHHISGTSLQMGRKFGCCQLAGCCSVWPRLSHWQCIWLSWWFCRLPLPQHRLVWILILHNHLGICTHPCRSSTWHYLNHTTVGYIFVVRNLSLRSTCPPCILGWFWIWSWQIVGVR